MKFILSTTEHFYRHEDMLCLQQLGFRFRQVESEGPYKYWYWIDGLAEIEVDSLEELMDLSSRYDCPLILTAAERGNTLELYDGYRE